MSNLSDFVECEACRSKPGTPVLCDGCLHNRKLIGDLKSELGSTTRKLEEHAKDVAALKRTIRVLSLP